MEKIYGILTNLQNLYTAYNETQKYYNLKLHIQGEHKVFPWLQTLATKKLHVIQTYFFFTIT